ncbi:hypothetical protein [Psychromonas aquatilis]|uniref:Uncharacterized protein n=1 Tax=Psychromonas aquatilis TaxID=2005072 RepID=A0ABU9GPJ0_9GAMM
MGLKILFVLSGFSLLMACSSSSVGPVPAGQDSYLISKEPSTFSNNEDELLASILSQANDYCIEKERYMEVRVLNEYFNFFGGDSKTTLVFSCLNEKEAIYEQLPEVVIQQPSAPATAPVAEPVENENEFPQNITKFVF